MIYFERNLPSVDEGKRRVFIENMLAYHSKYKAYRDNEMNYEGNTDYQNELFTVSVLDPTDYWIYSPQFKRTVALMIGELFKTKIVHVSVGSPVLVTQDLVFFDGHMNRWMMSFQSRENEPDKLHLVMRFPRSNSQVQHVILKDEKAISDSALCPCIQVVDVDEWHGDARVSIRLSIHLQMKKQRDLHEVHSRLPDCITQ